VNGDNRTRVRILQAGLHHIALFGTARFSMSGVADASKMARGTIYRYFANSDELLEAIGEYVRSTFEERVIAVSKTAGEPRARLGQMLAEPVDAETWAAVERLREFQPAFTLEFLTRHTPDFAKSYRRAFAAEFKANHYAMSVDNFAKTLARIVVTGTLLGDDLALTRRLGLALWDSITIHA
jgi:AcrR family transcriptional regulator